MAQGHWYHPDGTQVESFTLQSAIDPTINFFARDRTSGAVRLRRFGNPSERGRFHCEVPNAAGDNVTVYVNIGEWFVSSSTASFYKLIFLCTIIVDWIPHLTTDSEPHIPITATSQALASEPIYA